MNFLEPLREAEVGARCLGEEQLWWDFKSMLCVVLPCSNKAVKAKASLTSLSPLLPLLSPLPLPPSFPDKETLPNFITWFLD